MRRFAKIALLSLIAVSAGCSDDDDSSSSNIGIRIEPAQITVQETGAPAQFKVIFSQAPKSAVKIQGSVSDPGECRLSVREYSYDPAISAEWPVFEIQGIDDHVRDGDQKVTITLTLSSADKAFNNIQPLQIPITVIDNGTATGTNTDIAGSYKITAPTTLVTDEKGSSIQGSVALNKVPTANVTITLTSSDTTEGTIAPATMTFNAQNYSTPQAFTITGVDDSETDGDVTYTVTGTAKSDDSNFPSGEIFKYDITNKDDDDQPACSYLIVEPAALVTDEKGKSIQGSIALSAAPTADITVTLTSSDTTEGIIAPATMTFNAQNYSTPQAFTITGVDDSETDGDVTYTVTGTAQSGDSRFPSGEIFKYTVINKDDDQSALPVDGTKIRFMAANITSGNGQSYDDGKGIRIFQAFKPDIVMIQEFNYTSGQKSLVETAFGPEFHFHAGKGRIPNGVISKYPITASGTWESNSTGDREWEWAVIDIPGSRDLLAVSVHLSGKRHTNEFSPLLTQIKNKQAEGNYYVVLGGDFNTKFKTADHTGLYTTLGSFFHVGAAGTNDMDKCIGGELPMDQDMSRCTSGERDDPYDWVLFDKEMDKLEIPITIGTHTYQNGHVIDSRVYAKHNELALVPPLQASDSDLCYDHPFCEGCEQDNKTNMQHQAVIRDIVLPSK